MKRKPLPPWLARQIADAARYRWLRDRPSLIGWDWWTPTIPHYAVVTSEFMDETIDAAIAAHQPKAV